jgi:hypothetical protein
MADASLLPLSADEKLALVAGLKRLIDEDRYPLSPRVRTLEAIILARPQPPKPAPCQGPRKADLLICHLAQQIEAARRRAQGATLQELADSYDRSISTMRRATRAA